MIAQLLVQSCSDLRSHEQKVTLTFISYFEKQTDTNSWLPSVLELTTEIKRSSQCSRNQLDANNCTERGKQIKVPKGQLPLPSWMLVARVKVQSLHCAINAVLGSEY